jgi:hypothetical protein
MRLTWTIDAYNVGRGQGTGERGVSICLSGIGIVVRGDVNDIGDLGGLVVDNDNVCLIWNC